MYVLNTLNTIFWNLYQMNIIFDEIKTRLRNFYYVLFQSKSAKFQQ